MIFISLLVRLLFLWDKTGRDTPYTLTKQQLRGRSRWIPSHLSHSSEVLRQGIHPNLIYTYANSYEWHFSLVILYHHWSISPPCGHMNFSMFHPKLKMKSLVVLVFAGCCRSECHGMLCSRYKIWFFFCSFTFAYVSRNQSPFIPEGREGGGCVRSPWILILPQQNLPDPVKLYSILMIPPHWWSVFCSSPFQKLW